MKSRERAYLRKLANPIEPIFQIGKGGISENMVEMVNQALEARELIKGSILQTCELTPREALDELCELTGAEGISAIGRKIVLYKESKENKKIQL